MNSGINGEIEESPSGKDSKKSESGDHPVEQTVGRTSELPEEILDLELGAPTTSIKPTTNPAPAPPIQLPHMEPQKANDDLWGLLDSNGPSQPAKFQYKPQVNMKPNIFDVFKPSQPMPEIKQEQFYSGPPNKFSVFDQLTKTQEYPATYKGTAAPVIDHNVYNIYNHVEVNIAPTYFKTNPGTISMPSPPKQQLFVSPKMKEETSSASTKPFDNLLPSDF